ncbi:serine/threonine protein kinase [Candidatus Aerophobetes bacterium]|uniref:Serine/threonine protein kinase n=1 Tax=Aerophobetes bacterium TaxID=2030807 RepID=A0A2A4X1F9_UNCAE|nr:MAG: serine/threonine protein kinase [Candidatus Aerophobetes bacterium]
MEKKTLGDYNIIKQIGQGTLGKVFLAEHRFLKKPFILKVIPEEFSKDRNFIQRFEKQVGSLAALEHPHIVKVHNVSFSDGYYFLVTDCIVDSIGETTNLSQYLSVNKQSFNEAEIFTLLEQIASALTYIHQKSIEGTPLAHRGIKLSNLLVGRGDKGLHVYLSDVGLSSVLGEGTILTRMYRMLFEGIQKQQETGVLNEDKYQICNVDNKQLSRLHASFMQMHAFLAPEQKIVKSKPVSKKADVYAFGVLAYFLLLHCYPEGHFPLPSSFYPDMRYDWDLLIKKTLDPSPDKRPSDLLKLLNRVKNVNFEKGLPPQGASESGALESVKQATLFDMEKSFSAGTGGMGESETARDTLPSSVTLVEKEETLATVDEHMLSGIANLAKKGGVTPFLKPGKIEKPTYDPDPGAIFQIETSVARYIPQEKEIKDVKPLLSEMKVIEGGTSSRGSEGGGRDERPLHQIEVKSFALDAHPVTNEQFVRFLEVMQGEKDANNQDIIRLKETRITRSVGKLTIESGYAKHPVVGVSWYGAVAYAKWVGKRLPTEAEWEVAAHGGNSEALFPTGNSIEKTQANFFSADTTTVMSYPANGYGLYDVAGNVYEWCQDWYSYNYYETTEHEPDNPQGPLQGVYRVLRGGCWKSLKEDLHCSKRHRNNPGTINKTYGFRCAANVQDENT